MRDILSDLTTLFDEAKQSSEFDFVLTLINYTQIGPKELSTNLHEWFEAIEFYTEQFNSLTGKNKTRIGALLYSTFFENSDFYNIIGSLCRIKLGYKGSSYLFWKTKKYERLLGIGEKQNYLLELFEDANKPHLTRFFEENHFKVIRNSYFHSAYSIDNDTFILHDSDPIIINGVGHFEFSISDFFYPLVDNVIQFFQAFKQLYLDSFHSYQSDKVVIANFPNRTQATILGSEQGLKGFKIPNSVQFYDKWFDSGIWYNAQSAMWEGHNIRIYTANIETIEIDERLSRYEGKTDIVRNDSEFQNLVDKILDRRIESEKVRATKLLVKFGNVRYEKVEKEENPNKQKAMSIVNLLFYQRAIDIGSELFDLKEVAKRIEFLRNLQIHNINLSKNVV